MGSFEYSTALNEVQNNDTYSIPVFKGIWFLDNYVLFWGWICTVGVIFSIVLIIAGFIIVDEFDY